jgi:Holliday junction resolvasome RuvABC ATP-dependent DNA helicase subunit
MKLSQAKQILMAAVQSNLSMNGGGRHAEYIVPYLIGGAGLGKTTLVVDAAKELGHWVQHPVTGTV